MAWHDPEPQPFLNARSGSSCGRRADLKVDRTRHARSEHIRFASDRDTNPSKPMNMIDSKE
jgi:hypothetical protein